MDSPSPTPFLLTFALTFAPSILLTAVCRAVAAEVILSLVQVGTLITMCLTSFTNPGIIPQILRQYERSEEMFAIPGEPMRDNSHRRYLMEVGAVVQNMKYCYECGIYRPLRSVHCDSCNHCVEKYDHHCPWLGVCIGKYNYKYFLSYLLSTLGLALAAACTCIYGICQGVAANCPISAFAVQIVVLLLAVAVLLPISSLLLYHFRLIQACLTTNEQIRRIYARIDNQVPFLPTLCPRNHPLSSHSHLYYRKDVLIDQILIDKGDRYSLLLTKRKSVLSHLLDTEL